jgi:hypothetical protein
VREAAHLVVHFVHDLVAVCARFLEELQCGRWQGSRSGDGDIHLRIHADPRDSYYSNYGLTRFLGIGASLGVGARRAL